MLGRKLKIDPLLRDVLNIPVSKLLTVEVLSPELCNRFSAVLVNGVKVGPSPKWLVDRLQSIGQKSINNVVDVMNYVMFDIGQPLHAFDRDKLTSKSGSYNITVRTGKKGEKGERKGRKRKEGGGGREKKEGKEGKERRGRKEKKGGKKGEKKGREGEGRERRRKKGRKGGKRS